jgi:uncharacterized damage-inducible protein DinB
MSIAESLLQEFDEEMSATRRVLERVPAGKSTWRPHPKSAPLGRLATHVAELPGWAKNSLMLDELNIQLPFVPTLLETAGEMVSLFDRNVLEGRAAIAAAPDPVFQEPWTLKMGGKPLFTISKFMVYRRMFLNHLVHHRAQLGVFLRLNDVALPGIYGPTADER